MSKQRSSQASNTESAHAMPPEVALAEFNGVAIEGLVEAGQTYWQTVTLMNAEMMKFAQARADANLEHYRRLSDCEDVAEMQKLQQSWAMDSAQAYTKEMIRLSQVAFEARNVKA